MRTIKFRHGKAALASAFAVGLIVASTPLAQSEEETTTEQSAVETSAELTEGALPTELVEESPITVTDAATGENIGTETADATTSVSAPASESAPATAGVDAQDRSAAVGPQADFKLETVQVKDGIATVKVNGTITDDTGLNKPMESLMLHKRGNKAEVSEVVSATYDGKDAAGEVFDFQPKEFKDTFGLSDEDAQFPQILRISLEPTQDGDAKGSLVGKKFSATYKVPAEDKDTQWVLLPTDARFLPEFTVGQSDSSTVGAQDYDLGEGNNRGDYYGNREPAYAPPREGYGDLSFTANNGHNGYDPYAILQTYDPEFMAYRGDKLPPNATLPILPPSDGYSSDASSSPTPPEGGDLGRVVSLAPKTNWDSCGNNNAYSGYCAANKPGAPGRFFSREHVSKVWVNDQGKVFRGEDFTIGGREGGLWLGGTVGTPGWTGFENINAQSSSYDKRNALRIQIDGVIDTKDWVIRRGSDPIFPGETISTDHTDPGHYTDSYWLSPTELISGYIKPGYRKREVKITNRAKVALHVQRMPNGLSRLTFYSGAGIEHYIRERATNPSAGASHATTQNSHDQLRGLKVGPNTPIRISYGTSESPGSIGSNSAAAANNSFMPYWESPTISKTYMETTRANASGASGRQHSIAKYKIIVRNNESTTQTYNVADIPQFVNEDQIEVVKVSVADTSNAVPRPIAKVNGAYPLVHPAGRQSGFEVGPHSVVHKYVYVEFLDPVSSSEKTYACVGHQPGNGAFNEVKLTTLTGVEFKDDACAPIKSEESKTPTISKNFVRISDYNPGDPQRARKRLTYDVVIDNLGDKTKTWEMTVHDLPAFPTGASTITSVWVLEDNGNEYPLQKDPADPSLGYLIGDSQNKRTWTVPANKVVTKRIEVYIEPPVLNAGQSHDDFACIEKPDKSFVKNHGAYNSVEMNDAQNSLTTGNSDDACGDIPAVVAPIVTKTIATNRPAEPNTIFYDITVTNPYGSGANMTLSVFDEIVYPQGVRINSVEMDDGNGGFVNKVQEQESANQDNRFKFEIGTLTINTPGSRTFTVKVKTDAIDTGIANLECQTPPVAGHGGYNSVTVSGRGGYNGPDITASTCESLNPSPKDTPKIAKEFVSINPYNEGQANERKRITYKVTITNEGNNTKAWDLTVVDAPKLPNNLQVTSVWARDDDNYPYGEYRLGKDPQKNEFFLVDRRSQKLRVPANDTVTKYIDVYVKPPVYVAGQSYDDFACNPTGSGFEANHGAYNFVSMSSDSTVLGSAETCGNITPPASDFPTISKEFLDVIKNGDNYVAVYDITVDNSVGNTEDQELRVYDDPKFSQSVTVTGVTVQDYKNGQLDPSTEREAFAIGPKKTAPYLISDPMPANFDPTKGLRWNVAKNEVSKKRIFVNFTYKDKTQFTNPSSWQCAYTPDGQFAEGMGAYNKVKIDKGKNVEPVVDDACGDIPQPITPISLILQKTDTDSNVIPLTADWQFELYPANDSWEKDGDKIAFTDDTQNNRRATAATLTAGKYLLVETKAPAGGYQLLAQPVRLEVFLHNDELKVRQPTDENNPAAEVEQPNIVKVSDVMVGDMPEAGGKGVFWMLFMGMALIAGAWFFNRRYQH